jgi:hypothetical protein
MITRQVLTTCTITENMRTQRAHILRTISNAIQEQVTFPVRIVSLELFFTEPYMHTLIETDEQVGPFIDVQGQAIVEVLER